MMLITSLLLASAATAPPAPKLPMATVWMIQPADESLLGETVVADGEFVLKQRLLPKGLAVIDEPVRIENGQWGLDPGGQLIEVMVAGKGRLFCGLETLFRDKKTGEMTRWKRTDTVCLHDRDSDGRFDAAFLHLFAIGFVPMAQGNTPKKTDPVDTPYRTIDPAAIAGEYFVALKYEQYFNIYGNRMLFTVFGGPSGTSALTEFGRFKSAGPYPIEKKILGAEFMIVAAEPKAVRVNIKRAMPPQPFGVHTYTTYRIY